MNFKNKNFKLLSKIFPLGVLLITLASCSSSQQLAGETDGVYFDPQKDQRTVYVSYDDTEYENNDIVRIGGKYFDKYGNAPLSYERLHRDNKYNRSERRSRYSLWGDEEDSRSNMNLSLNYMFSPYYNGFGWGFSYGFGNRFLNPYYYNSWGSPYYGFNDPYYWDYPYYGYNPYYYRPYYNPYIYNPYYYGGYYGGYYSPYYPYYGYNRGYYNVIPTKKSGADAIYRGNNRGYVNRDYNSRRTRANVERRSRFRTERRNNERSRSYRRSDYNTNYNTRRSNGYNNYNSGWNSSSSTSTPRTSSPTRNNNGFRTGVFK